MADPNMRAVPDGQYTQTIYSLIRDQKYTEVSLPNLSITLLFRLSTYWPMSYSFRLGAEPPYRFSAIATTTSKTTP